MKKIILITFAIFTLSAFRQTQAQRVGVSIDFNTFYTDLSPYGRWMDYPEYGRVWIYDQPGFRPYYSDGHWVYTDYGWTWVSDYPWGWAPFHYGRWVLLAGYGWAWVPGYEWAPAWVSWCGGGDDYYGWAPLSPGLSIGESFSSIPRDRWVFVPRRYITSPAIHNYYIDPSRNITVVRNTTIINNIKVNNNVRYPAGPQRTEVERVAQTRIQPVAIHDAPAPGRATINGQALNIYRPQVKKNPTSPETIANRQNVPVTKNQVQNNNVPQQQQVLKQKQLQQMQQQKIQNQQMQEQQAQQQKVKVLQQQKQNEVVQQQQEEKRLQQQRDLQQERNQQMQQQRQQEKIQQQRDLQQERNQRQQEMQQRQQEKAEQQRNQRSLQVQQQRQPQIEQRQQDQFAGKGDERKRQRENR